MVNQGSKLVVASSKFATWKSNLPPVENVGSNFESNFLEEQAVFHWNSCST